MEFFCRCFFFPFFFLSSPLDPFHPQHSSRSTQLQYFTKTRQHGRASLGRWGDEAARHDYARLVVLVDDRARFDLHGGTSRCATFFFSVLRCPKRQRKSIFFCRTSRLGWEEDALSRTAPFAFASSDPDERRLSRHEDAVRAMLRASFHRGARSVYIRRLEGGWAIFFFHRLSEHFCFKKEQERKAGRRKKALTHIWGFFFCRRRFHRCSRAGVRRWVCPRRQSPSLLQVLRTDMRRVVFLACSCDRPSLCPSVVSDVYHTRKSRIASGRKNPVCRGWFFFFLFFGARVVGFFLFGHAGGKRGACASTCSHAPLSHVKRSCTQTRRL